MTDRLGEELVLLNAVTNAQRALLGLRRREAATDVMVELVRSLGGTVVPAHRRSADALPIDLTFGERETLLPVARPGTPARTRVERLVPSLIEQARGVVRLLDTAGRLERVDATDRLTGLTTRSHLIQVLERSGPGDRLVGIAIDRYGDAVETFGRPRVDALVRELGRLVDERRHPADHVARFGPGAVAAFLPRSGEDDAAALVDRVLDRWGDRRSAEVEIVTGDVAIDDPAASVETLDRELEAASTRRETDR